MVKKSRPKNKKANPKRMTLAILLLIVIVFAISIAYSVLSSTLTLNVNKITQTPQSWDVGFVPGTVNGIANGDTLEGIVCGDATVTATSVVVSQAELSQPQDSCTYPLTIRNSGTISAKLTSITTVIPSYSKQEEDDQGLITNTVGMANCTSSGATLTCGNTSYTITTDSSGNTPLTTNTTINPNNGETQVYLILKYIGQPQLYTTYTYEGGGFNLVYNQN